MPTQETVRSVPVPFSKSSFVRAVLMVSSGQILGSLIQIAAAPLLGRLYTPQEYGILGGYIAVATVLASLGNWQLAQGIVVERCANKAASLVYACNWATLGTSILASAVAAILVGWSYAIHGNGLAWWYVLLPLSTFVGGYSGTLSALANRQGVYRRMALVLVVPVALSVATSIAMGWLGWGATGLLFAYFLGQVATLGMYLAMVPRLPRRTDTASWNRMRLMVRKYRRFAVFTTPTTFVSSFSMNAPIYVLTAMGATTTVGLLSRANQLLSLPVHLIGSSVAQVFQRRAAIQYHETGNCWPIYRGTLAALVALGAVPTVLLAWFAPMLFTWFLGPNWTEAGQLARVLAPMLLLRVICSPLSTVFYIAGKQREDFLLSIATSGMILAMLGIAVNMENAGESVTAAFSIGSSIAYMVYIVRSAYHANPKA
ncbi:MAG: lipopolysaccharide biosynthesis protein [Planctomycetota bacterium]